MKKIILASVLSLALLAAFGQSLMAGELPKEGTFSVKMVGSSFDGLSLCADLKGNREGDTEGVLPDDKCQIIQKWWISKNTQDH